MRYRCLPELLPIYQPDASGPLHFIATLHFQPKCWHSNYHIPVLMMIMMVRRVDLPVAGTAVQSGHGSSSRFRVTAYPTEGRQARAMLWNRGSQPGQNILVMPSEDDLTHSPGEKAKGHSSWIIFSVTCQLRRKYLWGTRNTTVVATVWPSQKPPSAVPRLDRSCHDGFRLDSRLQSHEAFLIPVISKKLQSGTKRK